ncbi:MAG TPA: hypothetical protein VKA01_14420 [Vicinamibacteria bacterium]|nr:hypothetical protein [Vicinamibacteria bacterium]
MPAVALELNDAGLLLLREGEPRPAPESPGVALFEGQAVVVGAAAAARACLVPRAVHDRFWDPLGPESLGIHFPPGLRRADVAHAHLRSLRDALQEPATEVLLAVPGFWQRPALSLLLSLARHAGLPVVGLVDAAVAAGAYFARAESFLHVDITRHRSVLTTLRGGESVERVRTVDADCSGQAAAERLLREAIARRFVLETRFDPLHSGASEQALQDALTGWLAELHREETCPARLRAGRREHTIELSRRSLASDLDPLYRTLLAQVAAEARPSAGPLLVSARAARLPGLLERLRTEVRGEVIELPPDAAVSAALRFRARIRHAGEAVPFVTRLAISESEADRRPGRRPTHLMNGGVAHAIGDGIAIGTAPPSGRRGLGLRHAGIAAHHCSLLVEGAEIRLEVLPGGITLLNGEPAEDRAPLRAGDRLSLGEAGVVLQLVAVEEGP